jgi:protein-S-isoprenylcysteine O-methyltransferase Ste14
VTRLMDDRFSAQPPERRAMLEEAALRLLAVGAYGMLIYGVLTQWLAAPGRVTLVLLLVVETFTLGLIVFARRARVRDTSYVALLSTVFASFYFVLLSLTPGAHLLPETVAAVLQMMGLAMQIWAKWTLGRSFGLLPAQRGLVTGGPYAVVRHPIYLGYFVAHVGFLSANFSLHNVVVLAVLYGLQWVRITREELLLTSASSDYVSYAQRVRWRVFPGVL